MSDSVIRILWAVLVLAGLVAWTDDRGKLPRPDIAVRLASPVANSAW